MAQNAATGSRAVTVVNTTANPVFKDLFVSYEPLVYTTHSFDYRRWYKVERDLLVQVVAETPSNGRAIDWEAVSQRMNNRNARQCMRQYAKIRDELHFRIPDNKPVYEPVTACESTQLATDDFYNLAGVFYRSFSE